MKNIVYTNADSIYINLTNRCSNDCAFCVRNSSDEMFGYNLWIDDEPNADEIKSELNKLKIENYKELVFCGFGEPTYRVDVIKEIGSFAHKIGIKTRMNTNGQGNLINGRDISKDIVDSVDVINVSLNEVSKESYDRLCRSIYGKEAYDALLEFAKLCIDRGGNVVLSIVDCVSKESIIKAKEIADNMGATLRVRKYS